MDTVDEVKRGRGRPKKNDPEAVHSALRRKEAIDARERKAKNKVVEKWYEEYRGKLLLCKKKASGSIHRTFIGDSKHKEHGKDVIARIQELQQAGKLRTRY